MIEKIAYIISATIASIAVIAVTSSSLHAKDLVASLAANSPLNKRGDDKIIYGEYTHNHTHRFTMDSAKQLADQRALRKYIYFSEKRLQQVFD